MRFVPPLAALADGRTSGSRATSRPRVRPMAPLLDALDALGAPQSGPTADRGLPFTVSGPARPPGRRRSPSTPRPPASTSPPCCSSAPGWPTALDLRHVGRGPVPSLPHIAMTVAMLRERGVEVDDSEPDRWRVSPGTLAARDVVVEPDLSNAAPFLAAAARHRRHGDGAALARPHPAAGRPDPRQCSRPSAPRSTGATATSPSAAPAALHGVDLDLREASELTPVVAAVAALAEGTTRIRGVGAHPRPRDRPARRARGRALGAGLPA